MLNAAAVAFGLVWGSFANVLIARLPEDESIVKPRSRCPGCKKLITWKDNIPVLSYLLLRGRCRSCHAAISLRYPVVELLTALLFVACAVRFGLSPLLILRDWPLMVILVAITFIDLRHRIIPDELNIAGLVIALATCWWVPGLGVVGAILGGALGFGIFYGLAVLYRRSSGRDGLGGGDVKLLAMLGAFVGPAGVVTIILVSSILGTAVGLLYGLLSGQKRLLGVSVPYGPFLVVGALVQYFLGDALWLRFMIPT